MIFLGAKKNDGIIWKIFSPLNPPKGDFVLFALNQGPLNPPKGDFDYVLLDCLEWSPLNPPKGDFDYVLLVSHELFYATKHKDKKIQEDCFYFTNKNFPFGELRGTHELLFMRCWLFHIRITSFTLNILHWIFYIYFATKALRHKGSLRLSFYPNS